MSCLEICGGYDPGMSCGCAAVRSSGYTALNIHYVVLIMKDDSSLIRQSKVVFCLSRVLSRQCIFIADQSNLPALYIVQYKSFFRVLCPLMSWMAQKIILWYHHQNLIPLHLSDSCTAHEPDDTLRSLCCHTVQIGKPPGKSKYVINQRCSGQVLHCQTIWLNPGCIIWHASMFMKLGITLFC